VSLTISAVGLAASLFLQAPAPESSPGSGAYEVGPGDLLKVTVFGSDALTQTVVIRPDGTLQFPLVGRVDATGRTPESLAGHLAELLANGFVRNPQVSVVVQEYRSHRVFVIGEVGSPGTYALTGPTTVLEILARAGLSPSAVEADVSIIRAKDPAAGPVRPNEPGAAEILRFRLADLRLGDVSRNLVLRANDTVLVSPGPRVFVSGEVRNPGSFAYSRGLSARQAIALAGGLSEDGSWKGIRVVRTVEGETRELKARPEDPVLPGDIIEVRAKLF
jgi:polysaccharide export outer membrane protein